MNAAEIATKLNAKRNGNGWTALCPAHNDHNPSLSIGESTDGKTLLHCFAGCTPEQIVAAVGLKMSDLILSHNTYDGKGIVSIYDYTNADGKLLFQVVRYVPKNFRQRRPNGNGGWIWNMDGVQRVLYRLPELIKAKEAGQVIYVAEGEKDCDALVKLGLCATCNAGGAGKWQVNYTDTLADAHVIIIADKDETGKKHAMLVASVLHGKAVSVKVLELPDRNGASVKDAHDWVSAGGGLAELQAFVEATPLWTPSADNPVLEITSEPETWEKPISFDAPVNLPSFPREVLSEPFKSFVEDVSTSKQVPPDLPGVLVLGTVAMAAAKRFRIYIGQSHDEPLNLFLLALMEPGSRKSDTFRACLAPVENFEIELVKNAKPEIARAQERRAIEEARLCELRKQAGNAMILKSGKD